MHPNCQCLFDKYAKRYFKDGSKVLEIFPSRSPSYFCTYVSNPHIVWETVHIRDDKQFTYRAKDEYSFPIPDLSFDIVFSNGALEHIKKPWEWIKEASRVCKVGGTIITLVPISWPYHEAPVDCWRIYPEGMSSLYEAAGLRVDLSVMESLEYSGRRKMIPGQSSVDFSLRRTGIKNWLKEMLRWPVTASLDTIAIATKIKD